MQALIIDAAFEAKVREIRDFACRPENVYHPGPEALAPEDNPNHVVSSENLRMVFSLTWDEESQSTYRHLSVSVTSHEALPNPAVVEEVMQHFGFVGGLRSGLSQIYVDQERLIVVIAQSILVVETPVADA